MVYDIIIVGAGPAGLTAGVYAGRAEKKVLILDALTYGGQIVVSPTVENFPTHKSISGFDFATSLYEQATSLGCEIEIDKVVALTDGDIKTVTTENGRYQGKAVIIATGAKPRVLGFENESALLGAGVSYCAVCDGAFYKGKTVAVNGGGNTAFEDALYLTDYCEKVYLIHRRSEFRAEEKLIRQLKGKANAEIITDTVIESLNGKENLESLTLKNKNGSQSVLPVEGLFVSIGRVPDTDFVQGQIELDNGGYAVAGENCLTKIKGVFVAGDCRTKTVRQLTTAVSDGTIAALAAINYIDEL